MGVLDGRVCVITGGGRGLGREHALLFAREGAKVVVNDPGGATDGSGSDATAAHSVVEEITAAGGDAIASTESVADWAGARRIVRAAVDAFGDLHVVVNNAAIVRGWSLLDMTEAEFDTVTAVALKGTFNLTRWAAVYWHERAEAGHRDRRAIVNTSSGAGLHGNAGQANYGAAKAGVAALTVISALELERDNVRVNCVVPIARTRLAEEATRLAGRPEVAHLLARPAFDPANVAPVVAALAADGCPFTGQVFSVVGGTVGIYAGWSIAEEIRSDERWTVTGLIEAMDTLPRSVPTEGQLARLAALAR